ncbi:hypothetical protein K3729_17020 [Rhodobacteraceae bacterium S2214]|nr:hypothetical protein K3729_17020 [Rhodobacteraceae bacterium S2214]
MTQKLWDKQNQHPDDRFRLFRAVGKVVAPKAVLYAGSYVDVAPSFIFPNVTYVDMDRRAKRFFEDETGVKEIVAAKDTAAPNVQFSFIHTDYAKLSLPCPSSEFLEPMAA